MKFRLLYAILISLFTCNLTAYAEAEVRGRILDAQTGEELIGAAVIIKEMPGTGAISGLDGSFAFDSPVGECTLVCSSIGYKNLEIKFSDSSGETLVINLEPDTELLDAVVISADNAGRTEIAARGIEKSSMNVVNVMSAKAIELSPDMTVANAVRRMSGVTVERNSSGEGRYAILRGMDKRYNYTLVNGVKIPSPDNKNRFVPLDIFPSEMLDRLEVTKSLTADMEGDGIGGAVNLVMKDAPGKLEVSANLASGYSAIFFDRDFESFSHRAGQKMSPYERLGRPEDYAVTMDDFTTENLHLKSSRPRPDFVGGFSFGNRYFGGRLGLMAAISYQNLFRGKDTELYYMPGASGNGTENRTYSEEQNRLGLHTKLDYRLNRRNKLMLYAGYMDFRESEVRNGQNRKDWTVKMQWNRQYIFNTTLKGEHAFLDGDRLKLDWSAVYSKAYNTSPDNARIYINMQQTHLYNTDSAEKRWEHNSDRDFAGYVNLSYTIYPGIESTMTLKAGGMYRNKIRDSFFNEYTFDSATGRENLQYYGEDWTNFDELLLEPRRYGNIGDPLNYDAWENIAAGYMMAKYEWNGLEVIAGVRAEHTDQGYRLDFPRQTESEGSQDYVDILPSLHIKYAIHDNANLRFSYGRSHYPQRRLRREGKPRPRAHGGRQPRPEIRVLPEVVRAVHGRSFLEKAPKPHRNRTHQRGAGDLHHPDELRGRNQRRCGGGHHEILQLVRNQGELHLHQLQHNDQQESQGRHGSKDREPDQTTLRPGSSRSQPVTAVQLPQIRHRGPAVRLLHRQKTERNLQLVRQRHLGGRLRRTGRLGRKELQVRPVDIREGVQPPRLPRIEIHQSQQPHRVSERLP